MSELFDPADAQRIRLSQGSLRYWDRGSGPVLVFVHGLLVNANLWRKVVPRLEDEFRCIVPDWPLGAHREGVDADADLTPAGLARWIAELLEALDLRDVTLVGHDTGGALCQIAATEHPARLGALVLTPCDAYENFLPPRFRYLQWLAHVPGAIFALVQGMRPRFARRLPIAFGGLAAKPIDDDALDEYVAPALASSATRRDLAKVLRGISPRYTQRAAERARTFEKPVLLAWARRDRFFGPEFAERLARAFPKARLEMSDEGLTFLPEDEPEWLAARIGAFCSTEGGSR